MKQNGGSKEHMKLLVMSDSHGYEEKLINMMLLHKDADAFVFLGDGAWDFYNAVDACGIGPDKTICQVRGNCDRSCMEPELIVREFAGVRFLITHGHEQNVKCGLWSLADEARRKDCRAALYGHTHRKAVYDKDGVTLVNPGSAANDSYTVIEIIDGRLIIEEH